MAAQMGEVEDLDMSSDTKMELFCKLTLNEYKTYLMTVDQDSTADSFAAYL